MKALQFNINTPRFMVIQALRPVSRRFCFEGPFSTVKMVDIPEPRLPSPEWVRIKTRLCGFCGSDLNLVLLKDSPTASPFTSFPCVPGHEICGGIVETGKAVKGHRVGDMVTIAPMLSCVERGIKDLCRSCAAGRPGNCENSAEGAFAPGMFTGICRDISGGFAEYLVAHRSQLHRIPAGVSPESATLVEPFAVALQAVLDNPPSKDDKILVIGGGVLGIMVVKAIRGLGLRSDITVVEPSIFHGDFAMDSGADRVIRGGVIDAAVMITGGRAYKPLLGERILMGGFDRIYDTVGHAPTINTALRVMAGGGTLSVIGIGKEVKLDLTPLWLKLQTVKGCYAYGYNTLPGGKKHAFETAIGMIHRKKVRLDGMLTHVLPIEKYRELIRINLEKEKNGAIKTAIGF